MHSNELHLKTNKNEKNIPKDIYFQKKDTKLLMN